MRATTDIRELRARMEQGMATAKDARTLFDYIDHLIWEPKRVAGTVLMICRHCGLPKDHGHASYCAAQAA